MSVIKCLLTFKKLPIADRPIFATGVKDGVYGNPTVFVAPPIPQADFELFITEYTEKRSLYERGGEAQKPAWEAANANLIKALVTTAEYVNTLVYGNENIVILAGYRPSKSNSSNVPKPTKLKGVTLKRDEENSGKLIAECKAQAGVNAYVALLTEGAPLPPEIVISETGQLVIKETGEPIKLAAPDAAGAIKGIFDFNQLRRKEFVGLTPLSTYYVVFFGINAGGVGSLSDAASVVCL